MKFEARKMTFGARSQADDDDQDAAGIPTPRTIKIRKRRMLAIREADQLLAHLPELNESVHALCSRRLDLDRVIGAILDRLGHCDKLIISTLGYRQRNLSNLLKWLDTGAVSELTLLASLFFRSHNAELWTRTLEELHQRGQRAACVPSHAKVTCLFFRSGLRYVIEGSANLAASGSVTEQIAVINSPELCDWHAAWIETMVSKHDGHETQTSR